MRESGQTIWWRKTGQLAAAVIVVLVILAVMPLALRGLPGGSVVLGLPLAYFLFAIVVPFAIMVAVFWFARRQYGLDHWYDVTGDQT